MFICWCRWDTVATSRKPNLASRKILGLHFASSVSATSQNNWLVFRATACSQYLRVWLTGRRGNLWHAEAKERRSPSHLPLPRPPPLLLKDRVRQQLVCPQISGAAHAFNGPWKVHACSDEWFPESSSSLSAWLNPDTPCCDWFQLLGPASITWAGKQKQ